MSGAAVDVAVRIALQDSATPGIDKAAERINQVNQKTTEVVEKSNARQRTSYERTSQARELLGVRSEQRIQREIAQTEAAYKRLMDTGKLSAQEQARALDATTSKVTKLTNEMGKLTAAQEKSARGAKALQVGGAVVAGVVAGKYALQAPVKDAISYDRRLANMANTAYSERDESGRKVGMSTLEGAVNKARKFGGGTREQAAEALDKLIASGTVSDRDAMTMLPGIMKASTASGASASELANIAIRAKQSFKIKAEDLPSVLSAAMVSGQAGGFELKDMAKWLPQQMAMAGNLGISGKDGIAKLMAWNQASVITSGTKDEAGNNLKDLLSELNSGHFTGFMAQQYMNGGHHLKKGQKESAMKSVDDVFLDYQSRGVDKVSATMEMMEKIISKDKNYQVLQAKLKAVPKDDKDGQRAVIESMAAQMQGTAIGKVFHNQQSLAGFLGLLNNQVYVADVLDKTRSQYGKTDAQSEVTGSYGVIAGTSDFKLEQAGEDKKVAEKAALDGLTPAIGKAAEAFGNLASKYPALTGGTILATTGLTAVAGAAGLAALTLGGGKGAAITNAAGRAMQYLPSGKTVGRAGVLGLGAVVGGAGLNAAFGEESAISRYGSSALNGAATGALIGSVIPGLGTAVGAAVGGALGLVVESLKAAPAAPPQEPPKMSGEIKVSVTDDRVHVASTKMNASNMNASLLTDTGSIWNGAM